MVGWLGWSIFGVVVAGMLALDLGVFHKKSHTVGLKEAFAWSGVWIGLSLLFAVGVAFTRGTNDALLFTTAWLVEKSLSLDNVFVFMVIFRYFRVAGEVQHKLLFYGIVGSLIMRAIFIVAGIAILERFEWVVYLLGLFLVGTGIKMAVQRDHEVHPERNPVLRLTRRLFRVTDDYRGDRFFVREERAGKTLLFATPLFVVLLVIETSDVMFAVDSVPAVLAVTTDLFLVYTSNVFAILGLRALYFALHGTLERFRYLHAGLALVLVFVGVKMLVAAAGWLHLPPTVSLAVIAGILGGAALLSVLRPLPPSSTE